MRRIFFLFYSLAVFSITSCSDDFEDEVPVNFDLLYYPMESGSFRVYSVFQVDYFLGEAPDTSEYFIRELVGDTLPSLKGEQRRLVNYFRKDVLSDTVAWELTETKLVIKDDVSVVETINNRPIVQLVFPFVESLRWDSNVRNSESSQFFEMRDIGKVFDNQIVNFEESVSIFQSENLDTLISRDFRKTVYASEIGLVEKEFEILDFCQESDCFGQGIVDEGQIFRQTIIEYGVE